MVNRKVSITAHDITLDVVRSSTLIGRPASSSGGVMLKVCKIDVTKPKRTELARRRPGHMLIRVSNRELISREQCQ